MKENPKNLVGYCGLYCGACGIYQGKIKQAVEDLHKIVGYYGFDKIMPELAKWEPAFRHYTEFESVMNGLVKIFGECSGCARGGGNPECVVRECCIQNAHAICAECTEMETCEKLQHYPLAKEEMQKIKAMGIDKWGEMMQKKVDAGYCTLDEKFK